MNDLAQRAFVQYEASPLPVSVHRMISADFQWERCQGKATIYRMPRDLAQLGIPGQCFAEARVPVASRLDFDTAIQNDCVDQAWSAFTSAMEQVAINVTAVNVECKIPQNTWVRIVVSL